MSEEKSVNRLEDDNGLNSVGVNSFFNCLSVAFFELIDESFWRAIQLWALPRAALMEG
jgi:hypothetical protein